MKVPIRQWLFEMLQGLTCCLLVSACQKPASDAPLRVAISPYQEEAMLANIKPLGLEKKYGTTIELVTIPWEDVVTALGSARDTIDVGFVALSELWAKQALLNTSTDDPVVFVYPTNVFGGMGFITFNPEVPVLRAKDLDDTKLAKKFLSYNIGIERYSQGELMLFVLARHADVPLSQVHTFVTTYNDGLLAAQNGSLDVTSVGLTQRAEALKRGGRVVLAADTMGFYDGNGFACKLSTLRAKRRQVQALVRMWFDCVSYVCSDMDHNSRYSREYLDRTASTRYTLAEYKQALAHDYLPRDLAEVSEQILSPSGKYSLDKEYRDVGAYLTEVGVSHTPLVPPQILDMSQ